MSSSSNGRRRRLWVLNHYAQEPDGHIGRTGHYTIGKYLTTLGWDVSIIAASVEHYTNRQRLDPGEKLRVQMVDGVEFFWLRTPGYGGNGPRRIINVLTYTARSLALGMGRSLPRPDVIVGTTVHPFAAWAASRLARHHRVPFIFEVRDLWPETLIDMGKMTRHGVPARALRRLERQLCDQAAHLLFLPPRAGEYYGPLGVGADRMTWLPNGVDLADFPDPGPPTRDRPTFDLMYFGAHGSANGLATLIDAMADLRQRACPKPVRLRLIGDGPTKSELQAQARALGLDNISFEPFVPRTEIPKVAAEADAFVFSLINLPVFRYGISANKLFDFMAGARPILFSCDASQDPVTAAGAGLKLPPENPRALADAVVRLVTLTDGERLAMGAAARRFVALHHDYPRLAERLAAVLEQVSGKPRPWHR